MNENENRIVEGNITREEQQKELTLEQELVARIFLHKIAVTGGVIMDRYMKEQQKGKVNLSEPLLEEMADAYSNKIMQDALLKGTFEELYNNAWNSIVETMPEHTKVI
jgi:hypothetical protein